MPDSTNAPDLPEGKDKPLVLVVDDNPHYARLFELLADKLNITTQIVGSCAEAIAIMEKTTFDLILMDWLMPHVDGAMCTIRIRAIEKLSGKHTPIIGVSGHTKANYQTCIHAGMDDFLGIPFSYQQLYKKIRLWLPNAHSPD